ncbi:Ni,Fe-hydrogenase maturation factor (hyh operon) [Burkholderiales bacterium]|nr:Ni,Fe-hydrogenase maturation factor (hyh operon) [Burkholderiales bacterium]
MSAMGKLRIIGVGSAAGDDQAGWLVVQALRRTPLAQRCGRGTRMLALDRPGVQLISQLEGADAVILIDAIRSGAAPGTIHRIDDLARIEADLLVSCHGLGLAATLELARALDVMPATLLLYGIEIDPATTGAAPSKMVTEAADLLAHRIVEELPLHAASESAPAGVP